MIRDALGNLQFTSNVMQRVTREMLWTTKFIKLLVSWTIIAWVIAVLLMQTNQVLANQRDYTGWGLPESAKARLGKGTFTDMQLSRDGTRLAIASSTGVWLYDVSTGAGACAYYREYGSHRIGCVSSRRDNTRDCWWGQQMPNLGC